MARIANPIYDAAFKYLMDEPRVAKTLIAAVLKIKKSDIIELTPDRNEIITTKRDEINACRLDFSVRIQTETGVKSIYIELQKAWAKGEMKRFRSYLAAQYTRASNVGKDNYPLPILSIYILGEKVDHLDGSVTYITRHYYNQEGLEINQDKPSWFVECLSHNMVVIQIPKIKPRPDSSLDNLLTMFDQSKIDPDNHHVICYDIDDYDIPKGELRDDMLFIVRRLEQATVSEEIRMKMDLEDKVEQMLFEKRSAEEKLVEQEKLLQEQASQLQQQKSQLQEKDSQLQEKDSQLQEQASQLQQQTARITKSIQKMYSRGESIEEIAEDFEVSVEFIKEVLKSVKYN